ncbi:hypothetical protein EDD21DRAFT_435096, partial [Dissophora ornata]
CCKCYSRRPCIPSVEIAYEGVARILKSISSSSLPCANSMSSASVEMPWNGGKSDMVSTFMFEISYKLLTFVSVKSVYFLIGVSSATVNVHVFVLRYCWMMSRKCASSLGYSVPPPLCWAVPCEWIITSTTSPSSLSGCTAWIAFSSLLMVVVSVSVVHGKISLRLGRTMTLSLMVFLPPRRSSISIS